MSKISHKRTFMCSLSFSEILAATPGCVPLTPQRETHTHLEHSEWRGRREENKATVLDHSKGGILIEGDLRGSIKPHEWQLRECESWQGVYQSCQSAVHSIKLLWEHLLMMAKRKFSVPHAAYLGDSQCASSRDPPPPPLYKGGYRTDSCSTSREAS